MISVQASGCALIVPPWEQEAEHAEPWVDAHTYASGLRVPRAVGDFLILDAVRASRGAAVAVDDDEMGACAPVGAPRMFWNDAERGWALGDTPSGRIPARGPIPRSREAAMKLVASADGTSIGYDRRGAGPALLLVHGTTADHRRWAGISPRLEERFTVYSMDRRGRGESGDGPAYTFMHEAEDVAAVVRAIDDSVFILGHSYGALCSLEAALLTEVARLILYEPPIPIEAPLYAPGVPERMQSLIDRGELESALEIMFREVVRMPEDELEQYRRLPMWKIRVQLAPTIPREMQVERTYSFSSERYAELGVPTLLLLGGDSPPVFRSAIEALDSALPNSSMVVMPGQQHMAMDTNPDLFLREVLDFLQS